MLRKLAAGVSLVFLTACGAASSRDDAAASSADVVAPSGTQLVPFVTQAAAAAAAAKFDARHPGWKTTSVDSLTGSVFYAYARSLPPAPAGPTASAAERVTRARAWLLADADINGLRPEDLATEPDSDAGPFRDVGAEVVEGRYVFFRARSHRDGYEAYPVLNERFGAIVDTMGDGTPRSVRLGIEIPARADSRHLPVDLDLTIGTAPKLAAEDSRTLAGILGHPLRVLNRDRSELLEIGNVESSDVSGGRPLVHIAQETSGVRLTMSWQLEVSKSYVDPSLPGTSTAHFTFVVDGATGALLEDQDACFASVSTAAWCEYSAAFEKRPFPGIPTIDFGN